MIITAMLLLAMPLQAALKDPTRPPNVTATTSMSPQKIQRPRWILTSTLISAQRRTAVINDTVVSHGDRINGAKVINIQPSAVRLRIGGRKITLMMLKKNIKSLSQMTSSRQGK
ncbi:MAG: general secretion pathway protein GspB [Gammaproteobacteria bacterium]|nr:general secretion pathway protein GspB [Gammaproteobacteria bacterium]